MKVQVTFNEDAVEGFIAQLVAALFARKGAVETALQNRAPGIEAWMKSNAPWADQTGAARKSLYARVVSAKERQKAGRSIGLASPVSIEFGYGGDIFYSVYLEYRWGGRFSILNPTRDHWVPILLDDIQRATRHG